MLPLALVLMLLLGASCRTSAQLQLLQQQPQSLLALVQKTSLLLLLRLLVQLLAAASLLKLGTDTVTSQLALLMQLTHGGESKTALDAGPAAAAAAAAAAALHATVILLRCWSRSKLRLLMLAVRTRLVDTAAAAPAGSCSAGTAAACAAELSAVACVA
jgi:hypothetical protein